MLPSVPLGLELTTAPTSAPSDGLQVGAGSSLTAKDSAELSELLRRHETFENLENRCLRDICRSTQLLSVDQGDYICRAGEESTAFIQILEGTAAVVSPKGVRQLLQGSAIGEDVLLGSQEFWPFSLRAESDVRIAWLEASVFKEVSMDLSGHAAARRRVLEAASDRGLSSQDVELLLAVLKVPLFQSLEHDQRVEVAKEVELHRICQGGVVELPKSDSIPFFVVLKGIVGRYEAELTASPESFAEEISVEAPSGLEEKLRAEEEREESWRRLEQGTAEWAELRERIRMRPLDVSLQERLRFHSLKIQLDQLRAELTEEEPVPEDMEPPQQHESHSSSGTSAASDMQQAPDEPTTGHVGVFLTMLNPGDADATSVNGEIVDNAKEEHHDEVLAEFYEGDFFGGWVTNVGPSLYRAHKDVVLLSISEEAWEVALGRCAATRHAARGELLRNCLSGIDDETVEKLLPHFKEETRHKGSVLVKAGQLSSSLWLIAGGRCSQAAAAPKPLQEDRPATEGRNREKHANAPKTKRRFFSATVELGLLEVGQAVGLTTIALQQPEPLTVTAASPEVKLLRADNLPQAKLTPKVLEALRLALRAKSSWLVQRFESLSELPAKLSRKAERMHEELERAKIPLVIDSPFLRRRDQALLPGMVALEAVCKHFGNDVHPESEWIYMHQERDFFMHMHLSHEEQGSRLPVKASQQSEPVPRPQGTSTMVANARFVHHQPLLWKTFRMNDEVMMAQESSAFSKRPEVPHMPVADRPWSAGDVLVPVGSSATPVPHEGGALEKPATPAAKTKVVSFSHLKDSAVSVKEAVNRPKPSTPRTPEATPGEGFKRRSQIKLRSNSRTFQMSGIEVGINEKRAVKEAKSKASYAASREPLVTPRDVPGGQRTTARQRAASARKVTATVSALGPAGCEESKAKSDEQVKAKQKSDMPHKGVQPAEVFQVVLPRQAVESASFPSSDSIGVVRRLSGQESELSVTPQVSLGARS
ncbi:unnamed protein product [Symbiodinium microadriaticum]|nr:unnamed protein product [Symbiodinium microadriaticum]